jgi:hypothetical protein
MATMQPYPDAPYVPRRNRINLRLLDYEAGPDDCWLTRTRTKTGYSHTTEMDGESLAHRIAWVAFHCRPIPDGHEVHHACGSRSCVNPRHLQLLTAAAHRALHRPPTDLTRPPDGNCRHGHPWSTNGTVTTQGKWICVQCRRDASARYDRKRRGR